MKRAEGVAIALATVLAAGGIASLAGVRLNHSPSMPRGLWLLADRPAGRGDIVIACLPANGIERRYLGPGPCPNGLEPVLKPVAAIEGDLVEIVDASVSVNGRLLQNTAPLSQDGAGRPLSHQIGSFVVPKGFVWLIVQKPDSFDSRYFGPVPTGHIEGVATPLLVWR